MELDYYVISLIVCITSFIAVLVVLGVISGKTVDLVEYLDRRHRKMWARMKKEFGDNSWAGDRGVPMIFVNSDKLDAVVEVKEMKDSIRAMNSYLRYLFILMAGSVLTTVALVIFG